MSQAPRYLVMNSRMQCCIVLREKSYNSSAGALLLLGEGKGSEMLVSAPALWRIVPLSVIYLLHRCIFGKSILCLGDPRWVAMKAWGSEDAPAFLLCPTHSLCLPLLTHLCSRSLPAFLPCPWGSRPNLACVACSHFWIYFFCINWLNQHLLCNILVWICL